MVNEIFFFFVDRLLVEPRTAYLVCVSIIEEPVTVRQRCNGRMVVQRGVDGVIIPIDSKEVACVRPAPNREEETILPMWLHGGAQPALIVDVNVTTNADSGSDIRWGLIRVERPSLLVLSERRHRAERSPNPAEGRAEGRDAES